MKMIVVPLELQINQFILSNLMYKCLAPIYVFYEML